MTAISQYLRRLGAALATGDATEHTHRAALAELLEACGPGIQALNEPRRVACGAPDLVIIAGLAPLGYVECKDVGQSLDAVQRSEQMARYLAGLQNLLLTDYLSFRWYVQGQLRLTATLATWDAGGKLLRERRGAEQTLELLHAFLTTQAATVGSARELAQRMAAIARLVCAGIEAAFDHETGPTSASPLHNQYASFKRVLLHELAPGEFADMYAQTVCYGLFAARLNADSSQPFARHTAAYALPRTNPFMRWLFGHLVGLEMDERIAWAVDDLVALLAHTDLAMVLQDFGRRTRQEDPVVHFYETFLQAYNPAIREARGVYYTPEPVVSFIVRSVDHLLRQEFHLADGLADASRVTIPNRDPAKTLKGRNETRKTDTCHRVLILDPACGTGTFLSAVLDQIRETLLAKGQAGAWPGYVREHLLPRLFGFELLMAPYAVAHLKLGLRLQESGYDFASDERLRVYLTNTLEEPHSWSGLPLFSQALAQEVEAANRVKRDLPIMVVLGNPPYSGHSENNGAWIRELLRGRDTLDDAATGSYFQVDGQPLGERNPKWLNDDYVKFVRWAQWRIARSGAGVLAFISNNGYLDNPTFRGMRQSLMQTFDAIYVLDLHGSVKKRDVAPDGSPDDNVFDIQQGVVIGLFVKTGQGQACAVRHADLWGLRDAKYAWLWEHGVGDTAWELLLPQAPFYLFKPQDRRSLAEYQAGWKVTEAMPVNVLGFQTHRDSFAIAFERDEMRQRIEQMRDPNVSDEALRERYDLRDNRDWKLAQARKALQADTEWQESLITCLYRPFDWRSCYFSTVTMDYPRRELLDHVARRKNLCLNVVRQTRQDDWGHALASDTPTPAVFIEIKDGSSVLPLYLYPDEQRLAGLEPAGRRANFAPGFVAEAERKLEGEVLTPEDLFHYIYALLHAPSYRQRYAEFLKIDFPRIPLTSDRALFRELARLGQELVALHLLAAPEVNALCTAFPATGDNTVATIRYQPPQGGQAGRVYINAEQYFQGIDPEVWEFMVGGYQVLEKWLKDRRGRQLSFDELLHYQHIVVALTETMERMTQIDERIEEHGGWPLCGSSDN
jgi:hypothetical protein